jgi:hypothetical protein
MACLKYNQSRLQGDAGRVATFLCVSFDGTKLFWFSTMEEASAAFMFMQ